MTDSRLFKAWAVEFSTRHSAVKKLRIKSGPAALCGRYWFASTVPPSLEGSEVALFKTREEARRASRQSRSWYTRLTPVRVEVTIRRISGG